MVYIIQAKRLKLVKIGYTENFESLRARFSGLQTGSPDILNLVAVIYDGTRELESELHFACKKANTHGEWFKVNKVVRNLISKYSYEGEYSDRKARKCFSSKKSIHPMKFTEFSLNRMQRFTDNIQ